MKQYKLLGQISLDFLTPQDQYGLYFSPMDNCLLECDEHTIWVIKENNERIESITTANAIDMYLRRGLIEEVYQSC